MKLVDSTRSDKTATLGRLFMVPAIGGAVALIFFAAVGFLSFALPLVVGFFIGFAFVLAFGWCMTRLYGAVFHGNDPRYQHMLKHGDPYLDLMPEPFKVRSSTPHDCQNCGEPLQYADQPCGSCGFGNGSVQCTCGTHVAEPFEGAFSSHGVICPNCNRTLKL